MESLDEHLEAVERHGFDRGVFPLKYNGHTLRITGNDGFLQNDGRLMFDFSLYCADCLKENGVSGRFPADDEDQIEHVCNARIAVFEPFCQQKCQNL